uniref:Transcription factor CBF/NF-Y/archaeal histone domain-containing protein n=1 Tax=Globodera rostochiensis TaxID=31243 RepID=A0A914GZZ1_GLORO
MTMNSFREVNRHSELPIARIKKIMKIEEGVKTQMISAEAPVLLAKAAELFIEELTLRSWLNTHDNRRKTIQKADIAAGAAKSEMFDFLIDILPRDELQKSQSVGHEGTDGLVQEAEEEPTLADNQNIQYIIQYADGGEMENSMVQLEDGRIIHATQIGQPIPLSAAADANIPIGQPLIMTIPAANEQHHQQHFHVVNSSNTASLSPVAPSQLPPPADEH